jgi:hypothetical protein
MSSIEASPVPNPEQQFAEPGWRRVVAHTTAWAASGFVLGANIANWKFPPEAEIGPGLVVRASITGRDGLYSDWGPLGKGSLPELPVGAGPMHGIRIDPISIGGQPAEDALRDAAGHTASPGLDSAYALFTHFDSTVASPIQEALIHRFLVYGGLGALGVGAVAGTIALLIRHAEVHKIGEKNANVRAQTEKVRADRLQAKLDERDGGTTDDSPTIVESLPNKERRFTRLRKRAIPLLGVAAMIGCSAGPTYLTMTRNPLPGYIPNPLPASITSQTPELAGGTFDGIVDPQSIMDGYGAFKANTDKRLDVTARNVVTANRSFVINNARYRELISSGKKYIKVGYVADMHCNFANMERVLPLVIKETNPDTVVELGDIENFAGTFPYEKSCHKTEVSKLGGRKFIWINGNHDKKKGGLNGVKEIDGLYFVGADDPEDTTFSSDKADDLPDLDRGLVLQGEYIARTACETYEKTGHKVIALAHRWQALSAAMRDGDCVIVGDSAHRHHDDGLRRISTTDGGSTLQHTIPSFSGAELNLPYYHYAIDGGYVMQFFDAEASELVAEVVYTFHTNGDVSINFVEPPSVAETEHMFKDYLRQHGHYIDMLAGIFDRSLPRDPLATLKGLPDPHAQQTVPIDVASMSQPRRPDRDLYRKKLPTGQASRREPRPLAPLATRRP